jgi:hypothetical protein
MAENRIVKTEVCGTVPSKAATPPSKGKPAQFVLTPVFLFLLVFRQRNFLWPFV